MSKIGYETRRECTREKWKVDKWYVGIGKIQERTIC